MIIDIMRHIFIKMDKTSYFYEQYAILNKKMRHVFYKGLRKK